MKIRHRIGAAWVRFTESESFPFAIIFALFFVGVGAGWTMRGSAPTMTVRCPAVGFVSIVREGDSLVVRCSR